MPSHLKKFRKQLPNSAVLKTKSFDRSSRYHSSGKWINPVFSTVDSPIPILQSISSTKSITLSTLDLASASVITQLDRKFILISIPRSAGRVIALIDQHAADERYRLERILQFVHSTPSSLTLCLPKSHLTTLEARRSALRQWGLEIDIAEGSVRIIRIPSVLVKDINSIPWREILASYTAGRAEECPPLLMNLFCSKACRSVPIHPVSFYPSCP